jgi:hypothetical protein
VIAKFIGRSLPNQWQQEPCYVCARRGAHPNPDHTRVLRQRQCNPVAKVAIDRYEDSFLLDCSRQDLSVIGASQPSIRDAHHVVSSGVQLLRQFLPEHLVEKQTHGGLGRS